MGFLKRSKSGPAGGRLPSGPTLAELLGGAQYSFTETYRFEPDDDERRGAAAPESVYRAMGGLKGGLYVEGGTRLVPWHQARGHVAARRGVPFVFFSVFDNVIDPTTATDNDPHSEVPLRSLPNIEFLDNHGGITGLELSPDGSAVATIEWASGGSLVIFDVETGSRRHVTRIEGIAGYESPLWSPAGDWILVNTWPLPKLIRVNDGAWATIPLEGAWLDWWPQRGPSVLLAVHGKGSAQGVGSYDLATGAFDDFGPIIHPDARDADPGRLRMLNPRLSPDGSGILIGLPHGPDGAYMDAQGNRQRVGYCDLATRQARLLISPFLDAEEWIEREDSDWKWVGPPAPASGPVTPQTGATSELSAPIGADLDAEADWFRDESLVRWRPA